MISSWLDWQSWLNPLQLFVELRWWGQWPLQLLIPRRCPEGQWERLLWILLHNVCQPGTYQAGPYLSAAKALPEEAAGCTPLCDYVFASTSSRMPTCILRKKTHVFGYLFFSWRTNKKQNKTFASSYYSFSSSLLQLDATVFLFKLKTHRKSYSFSQWF